MGIKMKAVINARQKYVEDLYKQVVKDFPEINEEEIGIRYDSSFFDVGILIAYYSFSGGYERLEKLKKPIINLGTNFFDESREEQEAAIAHELGHYMEDNGKDITRLEHSVNLDEKLDLWLYQGVYFGRRKVERLKDAYERTEISADNWAAKKGYAKGFLKTLNKTYDYYSHVEKEYDHMKDREIISGKKQLTALKESISRRIANIESKLWKEK